MNRPTPYRPRVPDDLFEELKKFSDGTFKGLHELTLRYIREGIEKDRAVQAGKDRKVPGNWDFPFPFSDVTINNWAKYYGFDVMEVAAAYHAMEHIALDSVDRVNGEFSLDGHDIKGLNKFFFGDNWERDCKLRELAEMESKPAEEPVKEKTEITVALLAERLSVRAAEIIKFMFKRGTPATMHQLLSAEEVEEATNAMQSIPKLAKRKKK
jgi:hypothetical protein